MTRKKRYAIVAIAFLLSSIFVLQLRHQVRSLSLDLVPTAESLIQKPIPLPLFIGGIHPKPGGDFLSGEKLCLSLFPGALMRDGDIYREFRDIIAKNTSFLIDNRPLPFMTFVELSYPAGGTPQVVKGQEVGTSYFCFYPDLEDGVHIDEVKTKDSAGNEFSYQWGFNVE